MLVGIVIGARLPLSSLGDRILRGLALGVRSVGLSQAGLNGGRRLRSDAVEMSERKRKLHGQRQKRRSRAMFDVRSEPLHADMRLAPEATVISAAPTLQYNIARTQPTVSTVVDPRAGENSQGSV